MAKENSLHRTQAAKMSRKKTKQKVAERNKTGRELAQDVIAKDRKNGLDTIRNSVNKGHRIGLATFYGDDELDLMIQMDTKLRVIGSIMIHRIVIAMIFIVIGLGAGLFFRKYLWYALAGGFGIGALTWWMNIKNTKTLYSRFLLERQLSFSQFLRLAAAYLPALKQGANLYGVFKKILPRMTNKRDRVALERLMTDMGQNPQDQKPFLEFAQRFSVSDRAELAMLTIHRMYLGDVDDESLRALANDANADMMKEIDEVIRIKISKFDSLTTKIAMSSMIVLFGYFGIMMFSTFKSMLTLMGKSQAAVK